MSPISVQIETCWVGCLQEEWELLMDAGHVKYKCELIA